MGDGLYEVRTNLPQGRKARVLFCIHEGNMVLLHGFIKKTQKTPKKDLDLARERSSASGGNGMKKNPHIGSSLDDLFEEEGTRWRN
jgi:Phage derived protein Gp49-like (DUF891)